MRIFAVILACSLASVFVACDDDDAGPEATSTIATASPVATDDPSNGTTMRVGEPAPFPDDLALIIQTGCWQCDGPITGFVRIRKLPDGSFEETPLFAKPADDYITGFGFDTASGQAVITTCRNGCDGFNPADGDEATFTYQSQDNGLQYSVGPPLDGWFSALGFSGGAALLTGPIGAAQEPYPLRRLPGNSIIAPPAGGFTAYPLTAEVVWTTQNRDTLLAADGSTLLAIPGEQFVEVSELENAGRVGVLSFVVEETIGHYVFRILDRDAGSATVKNTYSNDQFIMIGASLDECTVIGNANVPAETVATPESGTPFVGFLPAMIDFCDGVIHPITDPFLREPYLNGRNMVEAVQVGPFVSIAPEVGSCLNVRASPSGDAESLGCYVGGVLLRDLGESQPGGTQTWRSVATPAGNEGWASEEFLAP